MEKNNYHCGISINKISNLISTLHLFDDNYYYHGDNKLSSVRSLRPPNITKYDYYFPISKNVFNKFFNYNFQDLKQKKLEKIIEEFSLHEWII